MWNVLIALAALVASWMQFIDALGAHRGREWHVRMHQDDEAIRQLPKAERREARARLRAERGTVVRQQEREVGRLVLSWFLLLLASGVALVLSLADWLG